MSIRKRCAPCSVTESEMRAAKRQLSNKPVKRIPRTRIHFPSAAASLVATARSITAPITTGTNASATWWPVKPTDAAASLAPRPSEAIARVIT